MISGGPPRPRRPGGSSSSASGSPMPPTGPNGSKRGNPRPRPRPPPGITKPPPRPPPTIDDDEAFFGDMDAESEPEPEQPKTTENDEKDFIEDKQQQQQQPPLSPIEEKQNKLDAMSPPAASSTALVVAEPEAMMNLGEFVVRIQPNENDYSQYTNSGVTGNEVMYSAGCLKTSQCVAYLTSSDVLYKEIYPGVGGGSFDNTSTSSMGYLTISPRTLKPLEVTTNVRLTYWVLIGEVTVRSTACENNLVDGNLVLSGKKLSAAACFIVPPHTPYTVENGSTDTSAVLGYIILPPIT